MGEVYLAEHRLLKRACAIKLIRPEKADDAKALARFESEVRATARLTHWNTVEIYDYGHTEDGTFFYAMEFLPGMNLQEIVDRYGPLPPERVVHLLVQVCGALREAHHAGLIHRDIKPGNIFAAQRGGVYDVAKLLDFGLVKSIRPVEAESLKLSIDGAVIGSPLYTAPEAVTGDEGLGKSSDIYSLGATAYFLLTGRVLFDDESALKVLFAHAHKEPIPLSELLPHVPAELERIVTTCLQKLPADRFPDVESLEAALRACSLPMEWTPERAVEWWTSTADHPREPIASLSTAETDTAIVELPT
jgi:serine/threonine-protein kinase